MLKWNYYPHFWLHHFKVGEALHITQFNIFLTPLLLLLQSQTNSVSSSNSKTTLPFKPTFFWLAVAVKQTVLTAGRWGFCAHRLRCDHIKDTCSYWQHLEPTVKKNNKTKQCLAKLENLPNIKHCFYFFKKTSRNNSNIFSNLWNWFEVVFSHGGDMRSRTALFWNSGPV